MYFFSVGGTGISTQGFELASQELYCLSPSSNCSLHILYKQCTHLHSFKIIFPSHWKYLEAYVFFIDVLAYTSVSMIFVELTTFFQ
jgi:hypothetical protein